MRFGLVYVSGSCGVCICVVLGGDCLRLVCRPGGCAAHGLVGFVFSSASWFRVGLV